MARTMMQYDLDDYRQGVRRIYTFDNGYQASVVRHLNSYGGPQGLWELAVMVDEELVYDTPITSDVIGWMTEDDLAVTLDAVEALPHRSTVRITHVHPS